MNPELLAALLGAVVGAVLTMGGSFLQQRAMEKTRSKERADSERMSFVREVMRNRFNYGQLAALLNEVPLLFGDDVTAIDLYRKTVGASEQGERTTNLVDLIVHLGKEVGLSNQVRASDIQRGLVTGEG